MRALRGGPPSRMRLPSFHASARALILLSAAALPEFKTKLQERCFAVSWQLPTYTLVAEDGPPHARLFQVECTIPDAGTAVWRGEWQSSIKRAEGSAAAVALADLSQGQSDPPAAVSSLVVARRIIKNPHPSARSDLLGVCDTNGWPTPVVDVQKRASDGLFEAELTLDIPLPGAESLGSFTGQAMRKVHAVSIASAAAFSRVAALLRDRADAATGAYATLRARAQHFGWLLTADGTSVWVGGKPAVLCMASIDGTPICSPVEASSTWSGAAIGAIGVGLTKRECIDVAAKEVLEAIEAGGAGGALLYGIHGGRTTGSDQVPVEDYAPQQAVLATDDPREVDEWLQAHLYGDSTTSNGGKASRVRAVAIDTEWDASAADPSPSIVQVATREACLIAYVGHHQFSSGLRALLSSPDVAKVGKDLRQDWGLLRPLLGGSSAGACGWCEVSDFTVYHQKFTSMDTLTRAWLGKRYTFKGSTKAVDHDCWDSWPLSDDQLAYAAADVCAVIDVLHAIDSSDSLRSAQPSQHEKFKLPGPIVSGDFEDASE
jgi:hypothetical protein